MKYFFALVFVLSGIYALWFMKYDQAVLGYVDGAYSYVGNFASVFLRKPATVAELQNKYEAPRKKIRVLIVPGHEPNYGGTEYRGLKERDLNVDLADDLAKYLKNNPHYEVIMARSKTAWNPVLEDYFNKNWNDIVDFFKNSKEEHLRLVSTGQKTAEISTPVYHNDAPYDVAIRLYGMNKWEGENDIDIAIHIHFNDYPRKNTSEPGKYSGFAIYAPEKQYANSTTTEEIAMAVYKRLEKYNAASDLPAENNGFIQDPDLIAVGEFNTANAASMLIEYSYIYESQIEDLKVRESTFKDFAFQTYLGLEDFFGSEKDVSFAYDTSMLPYSWKTDVMLSKESPQGVLALQSTLILDGVYPPQGKDLNECPRSGKAGSCTRAALEAFQKKYRIQGEEGTVGIKTRKILNERYSVKSVN